MHRSLCFIFLPQAVTTIGTVGSVWVCPGPPPLKDRLQEATFRCMPANPQTKTRGRAARGESTRRKAKRKNNLMHDSSSFEAGSSSFDASTSSIKRSQDLIRRMKRNSGGEDGGGGVDFLARLAAAEQRDVLGGSAPTSPTPPSEAGSSVPSSTRLQATLNARVAEKRAARKAAKNAGKERHSRQHSRKKKKKEKPDGASSRRVEPARPVTPPRPLTPPSLRKSAATNSMQNLLLADNPVSNPASPRDDERRAALAREAARGVDLGPRRADRERLREQDALAAQQGWRLAAAAYQRRQPPGRGQGLASSAPASARRQQQHHHQQAAAAIEGRSRGMAAWGDALTNAVATSPSHWSNIAGHVFEGSARRVGGTDGMFSNAFHAVSRVSNSIGDVGSYLPAPPIPLPSSIMETATAYLPPPSALVQGVGGMIDKAAELGPTLATHASIAGMRAASQID
jgi:hypothetical protein